MQPKSLLKTLSLSPGNDTNAWRIFHDAEAGVWVDHFDGRWLVQTRAERFPDYLKSMAQGVARSIYWRPRDKSASTAPEHVWGEVVTERFSVQENGASFWIDFGSGYSSGIFLDQRLNRRRVGKAARAGEAVLNTFAYTGGFSVMAAQSRATTTTADLSKTYLDWTWDNFTLNGLEPNDHFGVKGDAIEWLKTFGRQGRRFNGVVLDPPTFSRKKKGTFSTDKDYASLAGLAAAIVEGKGWILACANTHRLSAAQFQADVVSGVKQAGRNVISCERLPMPPEFHGDEYLKSLWVVVQ
ncbi:class I SAM-dependent methyltransferase [Verrucomicrobiales bacterium BCK34]|nr:class I SAM-dependent methyltransferase [Verrucomicrobiales bacterium BCK34]